MLTMGFFVCFNLLILKSKLISFTFGNLGYVCKISLAILFRLLFMDILLHVTDIY